MSFKYLLYIMLLFFSFGALSAPKVLVDKSIEDFGRFSAKDKQTAVFTIKNTGDESLKLLKVRTTCGCSEVIKEKDVLKPGESAKITASLKPNELSGSFSKNFFVQTNDPDQRFLRLTMTGTAKTLYEVKPKDLMYVGQIKIGKEWAREFVIEENILDKKQPSIEYGLPSVSGPHQFNVVLQDKSTNNKRSIFVKVTPDKTGRFKSVITIPITSPAGWKPVSLTISGNVVK